jgi:glycosyltransferase involved in cell wall biosynthesis
MINVLFVRASVSASRGNDNIRRPFRVAQSLLDDGVLAYLEQAEDFEVDLLHVNLQPYYPHGAWSTRNESSRESDGHATFAMNLPILREVLHLVTAAFQTVRWASRRRKSQRVIFLMTNYAPVATGLKVAASLLGLPRVVTLTDLAGFSYSLARVAAAPWWKRPLLSAYADHVRSLERSYDGYVLLTEQMGGLVNPENKPQVIVEGVLNTEGMRFSSREGANQATVLAHAGTLDRLYGIQLILDAFARLEDPEAELWLFGTGDMDAEITQRQAIDPRIKFHGFRPRDEVLEALQQATLLLNLRDRSEEYTKYSFPSKLLEYMASGTPVVTTALAGIPDEYGEFVYSVSTSDPAGIAKELETVAGLPREALRMKGEAARGFVLTHKTADSQCPRIAGLIASVVREGPS